METSGTAFVEHWRWAAEKGLLNKNTAAGLRAACMQVLGVMEDWQNANVRNLDVDEVIRRFKNLKKKDFKPKTLEVYDNRFRAALSSYRAYLDDPGNWKPFAQRRQVKTGRVAERELSLQGSSTADEKGGRESLMDYPFPLRAGQTVRLLLPRDLKMAEVKRLNAFMATLAVDTE